MSDLLSSSRGRATVAGVIALLFIAVRVALLFARDPFFDELYTLWMARRPLSAIVPALLWDSGPPLYYFLARFDSVAGLRWLSLAFACVPLVILLRWRALGPARFTAAALLAAFPPAALFAIDARAYALCAAFVAAGIFFNEEERPFAAALAFVAAAYSHYYGVLFFPLLLWRWKVARRARVRAFVAACLLFAPGLYLASRQPAEAMSWMTTAYPDALLVRPHPLLLAAAAALVLLAVVKRWRFAPYVLVPLACALAIRLVGRPVYFPLRFESVIAVPLVLWIATSVEAWPAALRRTIVAGLLAAGSMHLTAGIQDHLARPLDPWREAALFARAWNGPIVASGYCYLESVVAMPGRRIEAWPQEQALHPGWRAGVQGDPGALPATEFLWAGERHSAELRLLRNARRVDPLLVNARAVVARIHPIR